MFVSSSLARKDETGCGSDDVPSIICRPMSERDIYQVHDIHTSCVKHTLSEHYSPIEIRAWLIGRCPQGYWHGVLAGEDYWVADYNGAPIGFASARGDKLLSLFVAPTWQRAGVGSMMLGYEDRLTGIWQLEATLNAVGFYQHFGFRNISMGHVEKRGVRIPVVQMQRI